MSRACGECTLCCRLVPVYDASKGLAKGANTRCRHQSFAKGCKVYATPAMPNCCSLWQCRWLVQPDETRDLSRPDRSGFVLDILPDFIRALDNETGVETNLECIQVWVDPKRPDVHRDPALRAYLERRAAEGIVALIRYNSSDGFVLIAPPMNQSRAWLEIKTSQSEAEHHLSDVAAALGGELQIHVEEGGAP